MVEKGEEYYKKMNEEDRRALMQLHQNDRMWNTQNVLLLSTLFLSGLAILVTIYIYLHENMNYVIEMKLANVILIVIFLIIFYILIRYGIHFYRNARIDHDRHKKVFKVHFAEYNKK